MSEVTFHGLDVGRVEPGDGLVERIVETATAEYPLQDGDVIVLTTKVVSIAEDRLVEVETIEVSERAQEIADVTGLDPREVALIEAESEIKGAVPLAEAAAEHLVSHAADPQGAQAAMDRMPTALVTERNGRLCTNAGVDWSNTPPGTIALLPEDPDASARAIREEIEERTGREVAVVLADSEIMGAGTMDVAIGVSGIEAIDAEYGREDLYGQPKPGGMDMLASELTAGAALLFGQADEQTPAVVVRGLDYERGEGLQGSADVFAKGLPKALEMTARLNR
jgi:coenzyme F420-0:L-glutamate ligase/coenzyme F420-1:gamma-L-glutamate ligase